MPGHPLFLAKYDSLMNSTLLFRKPAHSLKLSPLSTIAFSFYGLLSFVTQKSSAFGKLARYTDPCSVPWAPYITSTDDPRV